MKVAINGFGRIGRSVFRILDARADVDVVAINDLYDPPVLAYLLRYDTVMGPFKDAITLDDGHLTTARTHAKMLSVVDLEELPWAEAEVDVVVESTGAFRARRNRPDVCRGGIDGL